MDQSRIHLISTITTISRMICRMTTSHRSTVIKIQMIHPRVEVISMAMRMSHPARLSLHLAAYNQYPLRVERDAYAEVRVAK